MSRAVDVLAVLDKCHAALECGGLRHVLAASSAAVAEVFAAAHASLAARDLADQIAADDRLRAALAACEPETLHEPV